jgi:hypothetical protein
MFLIIIMNIITTIILNHPSPFPQVTFAQQLAPLR